MAEGSSADRPRSDDKELDLSSDIEFLGTDTVTVESTQMEPGTIDNILKDDYPDRLLRIAQKYGRMSSETDETERDEEVGFFKSTLKSGPSFSEGDVIPSVYKFARLNESSGLIELDMEKLERDLLSLSLDQTIEDDPSKKASNVESLKEKLSKYSETLVKDEIPAQQTEPKQSSSVEEQQTEKLVPYKFERKNKLSDRKPHLREMGKKFLLHKFREVNFAEIDLEALSKDLIDNVESELNRGVNILRRIAYPKLCESHFSPEFPFGVAGEDESDEDINISVDHFEFLHQELPIDFLQLFEVKDFCNIASVWEKDPQINKMVPSFVKFLQSGKEFLFPEKCFTLILAILKNPYRNFEFFYDSGLPVMKEQIAIAKYLLICLCIVQILDDKDAFEKLSEAIVLFANTHPLLHGLILEGFNNLISEQKDDIPASCIYSKVLNIMTSIGATFVTLCLPHHFEKISRLASEDRNSDLYFHLLRACEISIASTIEYDSQVKAESSDEIDLVLFYTTCYYYFQNDLTTRLMPIFRKYENEKNREEQYLSKKHSIFPTKDGYMDIEMQFLTNRNKVRVESESLYFPTVKEYNFNSAGKDLFRSSIEQLGYTVKEDKYELSDEDVNYKTSVYDQPLSYLEGVTSVLAKNN